MIEFRNVSYAVAGNIGRERVTIIDNLSLRVERGERLVLLGRSGCGKTTCLRLINRLIEATNGEVRVDDTNVLAVNPINLRRRIGYVIQDGGLFPHWTVHDNIACVPRLEKWDDAKIKNRVRELLSLVGLEARTFQHRLPHELSGGQRQRVGVARALAADAPVLLLDEPFGALDPLTRAKLQKDFRRLCEQLNKTVVFVTHDLREALGIASHIGLMDKGKIIVHATPEDFTRSSNELAIEYRETLS